jgi:MATE family multidrug resistance protein
MGIGSDSALLQPARSYLRIRALAAPAVLLISVSEGAFRGYGNTRIPLLASFIAAITNVILDPIFMFPMKMKVGGAAAATAISQIAAAAVYAIFLRRRKMMPQKIEKKEKAVAVPKSSINRAKIVMEILRANAAMFAKQGSLLFGWAYATARATRIGHYHVAAHQIALSFWLIFALVLDGSAVSAQVLMSRNYAAYQSNGCAVDEEEEKQCGVCKEARRSIHSLTRYMFKFAFAQGVLSTMAIFGLGQFAPSIFTTDPAILSHLKDIIPILAWQQILISLTLVTESLAIGASKFNLIAIGTSISTLLAIKILAGAKSVVEIWSGGIVALFVGRLITACIGVLDLNGAFDPVINWFQSSRRRVLTKNEAQA